MNKTRRVRICALNWEKVKYQVIHPHIGNKDSKKKSRTNQIKENSGILNTELKLIDRIEIETM